MPKKREYVYRVAFDKRQKKWVTRKVLYKPNDYDTHRTFAYAEELRDRLTRQDAERALIEKKEASRARIAAGLKSLTSEDLENLRAWIVALMQLRTAN